MSCRRMLTLAVALAGWHVPNLMTFFERAGYRHPWSGDAPDYLPGDLVAWGAAAACCTLA